MRSIYSILGAVLMLPVSGVHAQTTITYAFGTDACKLHSVVCYSVPITDGINHGSVWIDLAPYNNPTSSRFINGVPSSIPGWAEVNLASTYKVNYTTATYKTADGKVWTGEVPQSINLTFVQLGVNPDGSTYLVPNGYTGTATIVFGNYYYVDVCSRACSSVIGWYWSVVGGSMTVRE